MMERRISSGMAEKKFREVMVQCFEVNNVGSV